MKNDSTTCAPLGAVNDTSAPALAPRCETARGFATLDHDLATESGAIFETETVADALRRHAAWLAKAAMTFERSPAEYSHAWALEAGRELAREARQQADSLLLLSIEAEGRECERLLDPWRADAPVPAVPARKG